MLWAGSTKLLCVCVCVCSARCLCGVCVHINVHLCLLHSAASERAACSPQNAMSWWSHVGMYFGVGIEFH